MIISRKLGGGKTGRIVAIDVAFVAHTVIITIVAHLVPNSGLRVDDIERAENSVLPSAS